MRAIGIVTNPSNHPGKSRLRAEMMVIDVLLSIARFAEEFSAKGSV
jgi:hypothetical protein